MGLVMSFFLLAFSLFFVSLWFFKDLESGQAMVAVEAPQQWGLLWFFFHRNKIIFNFYNYISQNY